MEHKTSTQPEPQSRQPWEEPAIVLERSLEVRGQGGGDSRNPLAGFLGPLSTSNGGPCT
ncbi:MAG: hypothetical protein NT169_24425 [Chloroflexi bacterium]|nr:hypothetical protein [Chloroflexota bacterium]